jgi:hypothetical protein
MLRNLLGGNNFERHPRVETRGWNLRKLRLRGLNAAVGLHRRRRGEACLARTCRGMMPAAREELLA